MKYVKYVNSKSLLLALMQIIENKNYVMNFPIVICLAAVFHLYSLISGYITSIYTMRPQFDINIYYTDVWFADCTGTFLLYMTGNDSLTMMVWILCNIIQYSVLFYVILKCIQNGINDESRRNGEIIKEEGVFAKQVKGFMDWAI